MFYLSYNTGKFLSIVSFSFEYETRQRRLSIHRNDQLRVSRLTFSCKQEMSQYSIQDASKW